MSPTISSDTGRYAPTFVTFSRFCQEMDRDDAATLVALLEATPVDSDAVIELDEDVLRRLVRDLVDSGMWLRAKAHSRPDFDHERAYGGFIRRMFCHDQAPEADRLDRLALALVNGADGMDTVTGLMLMI